MAYKEVSRVETTKVIRQWRAHRGIRHISWSTDTPEAPLAGLHDGHPAGKAYSGMERPAGLCRLPPDS